MAFRILLATLFCFHYATAQQTQTEKKPGVRVPLDASKMTRLTYGYPPWNKDSEKIDSATLLLREGKTGRIIQISVEETAPDSSVFSGTYSLSWNNLQALSPEFYIPPQDLVSDEAGMNKITEMIKSGQLKRKAFILRNYKTGLQVIEIYDSKDQAKLAMRAFRAEEELTRVTNLDNDLRNQPLVTRSALDAASFAEQIEEQKRAAQSLIERARLSQIESLKAAENVKAYALLTPQQKKEKQKLAADTAKSALTDYQNSQLQDAIQKFETATTMDPENKAYYFQFAIALYKAEQFNRSLVILDLAKDMELDKKASVDPSEVDYYVGLNNYRLKLYKDAASAFDQVVVSKNEMLSSSAEFYIAVGYFEQVKYKEAQEKFQSVLDHSKDSKLDARAEQYIEQILRIQQFETERAKKWYVGGTFGILYDSNVTYTSDIALQNIPTNAAGERILTVGSLKYRPVYEADSEFAVQLDLTNIYTTDSSMKFSQALHNTDPFLIDVSAPYTFKGLFMGKGFKLDIIPGYESLTMSIDDNSAKVIQSSYLLKGLSTMIMSENWFANYNLELRQDNSNLNSSSGDDNESAINLKLTDANLFFLNKEKSKIFSTDASFSHNNAVGKNFIFDRFDLGAGYTTKFYGDTMLSSKLSYFLLNYSEIASARLDNSYTLSAGLSKKLSETLTSGFNASYNMNNSNLDAYTYKKYTVMLTLSYGKGF